MSTKLAFVFPGQGSQAAGMLQAFHDEYSLVRDIFAEASTALGYDLWKVCQGADDERDLNATNFTQPALLASSVALWRLWLSEKQNALMPAYLAGHSLGEYSALVCAEAMDFSDAVKVVSKRGQFMQEAVPAGEGGMAAVIKLTNEEVIEYCESNPTQPVSAANFNSPGQVVIAGSKAAVDEMCERLKADGKRAIPLKVSVPSHCALMESAAEKLKAELGNITLRSPKIPVLNNTEVVANTDPNAIHAALVAQLTLPVQWTKTTTQLVENGACKIVECGPGNVLSGLIKRTSKDVEALSIQDLEVFEKSLMMEL